MHLDGERFDEQFARFRNSIRDVTGRGFAGFHEGLASKWEEYKGPLRLEALSRLGIEHWTSEGIGDGEILKATISAIQIKQPNGGLRNNLVRWENRFGPASRSHRALLNASDDPVAKRTLEDWFFRFFRGPQNDARLFEEFRQLAGNRYDLVAYFFFLKDSNRFMPIAPTTFDAAFQRLGIDLKTSHQCSWENYWLYNQALIAVRAALSQRAGINDPRLLDAHSFCWMLVRVPDELLAWKKGSIEADKHEAEIGSRS